MAIAALSDADFARLGQVARLRARGLHHLEWSDLLHDAVQRTLDGTRRWPLGVPFPIFLREVIRSLASEARRVQVRLLPASDATEEILANTASEAADPEQVAIGRDLLGTLEGLFLSDPVGLGIVRGLGEGLSPADMQSRLGIDSTTYESARRRIRRRIAGAPEVFL